MGMSTIEADGTLLLERQRAIRRAADAAGRAERLAAARLREEELLDQTTRLTRQLAAAVSLATRGWGRRRRSEAA